MPPVCSLSSAHRRFQEWRDAGVFERFWQNGLLACMTKSPLAGSKNRQEPNRPGGRKAQSDDGRERASACTGCRRSKYARHKAGCGYARCPPDGQTGKRLRLCMDKGYEAEWLGSYLKSRRYEPHIQSRKDESEAIKNTVLRPTAGL